MPAITFSASLPPRRPVAVALALSISIHLLVLLIPRQTPPAQQAAGPLQARLRAAQVKPQPEPAVTPTPTKKAASSKRVLAVAPKKSSPATSRVVPQWSADQRREMDQFLNELAMPALPAPTLAQRSLAMARQMAQQQAYQHAAETAVVERLPNSPPIDPFGLGMYMEALVKKLNRSAGYVRNDPRAQGLQPAAVLVRLNPNGTLNSFRILHAGDQQAEIQFVRQVVEQAVPFASFPPDIQRSARTLGLTICIMPARAGGGFGFSRQAEGRGC